MEIADESRQRGCSLVFLWPSNLTGGGPLIGGAGMRSDPLVDGRASAPVTQ